MNYKCGFTFAYVDKIKDGVNKGKYGIFLKGHEYKGECKNKAVIPCETKKAMQLKLDIYAKENKLRKCV